MQVAHLESKIVSIDAMTPAIGRDWRSPSTA